MKTWDEIEQRLKAKGQPALHAPDATGNVPAAKLGYRLKGVSTLVGADGTTKLTWVKTSRDAEAPFELLEAFKDAVTMADMPLYVAAPRAVDAVWDADRFCVIPIGDQHLGMMSWPEETGEDFNLKIAETQLAEAISKLVALAPSTDTCLLVNLGDFLHSDGFDARTERGGHALDVDSRYPKMLRTAVWTLIRAVRECLTKFKTVRVINAKGNHDDRSSIMLSVCMAAHFASEPRVIVDESPSAFHWFEFGKNLLGITHGHTVKAEKLATVMAADQPEAWGRTRYRAWLTGHVHHSSVKEYAGVTVETFRTLAAKDAWAHTSGYRARRSICLDVYHREFGRVLRHEVGVEQLSVV